MLLLKKNIDVIIFSLIIVLTSIFAFQLINDKPIIVDESDNFEISQEISRLTITDQTFKRTTAIPGYSFTIGFIKYIFNLSSLPETRLISTIISLIFIFAFYFTVKKNIIKSLQIFFSPLIFTFLFILYNDIFSLLLVILTFFFLKKNKFTISGVFGLLSVLVRQNNIVWILFFCVYLFAEKYKFKIYKKNILNYLNDVKMFIVPVLFILLFLVINKGPALKDVSSHPLSFHFGNIYFFLLTTFTLFLPMNIYNLSRIINLFKKRPYTFFGLVIFFVFYFFTFKFDHLWNSTAFDFFIRNKIINYATQSIYYKLIFFLPIAYSVLSLIVTPLYKKNYILLYPFTFLFLGLSWLVEPRYSIIPYTFLLFFKKESPRNVEYLTLVIYILLSIYLFWGSINRVFFL